MAWFKLQRRRQLETQLFQETPIYVVVGRGDPDRSCVVYHHTAAGPVIRGFLSPFDAGLEAKSMNRLRGYYYAKEASALHPRLFHALDGNGFTLDLHVAWQARDGVILLSLESRPVSCCIRLTAPDGARRFEVEGTTLRLMDSLYEHAGLYAWRDTLREVNDWDPADLERAYKDARAPLFGPGCFDATSEDGVGFDQLAIFDPEAGQWHFVPRTALDSAGTYI